MKSLKTIVCYCLVLSVTSLAFTQEIVINGRVTDTLSQPIANVSVVASFTNDETAILGYTNTNEYGSFVLTFKKNTDYKTLWLTYR